MSKDGAQVPSPSGALDVAAADTSVSDAPSAGAGAPALGLVGQSLGRYRIVAELGHGGMAAVFRGHDPKLGRDVAIKVMHGFLSGRPELRQRFEREAQAVAALRHDAIVEIHDFEPAAGAQPGYIVAELIEGPTLRAVADGRGGRILPEIAALVCARIADGLEAAHRRGIVHRDIKPDNIMIDRPADAARVVLADFGVAHVAGLETMTATGALVGSPAYMSPEQARGEDVGPASDVFSLGVVLYNLVTGRMPFAGSDPLTVVAAILRGEFKRPQIVAPRVGATLERVIVRALRPNPADRYPSAAALRTDLLAVAAEAGLDDERAVLRRFFANPEATEAEFTPRVVAAAFEAARAAARRGDFTRALAEINRVFAYEPRHAGAERLLASIASRRRLVQVAAVVGALLAIGGLGYGATRWLTGSTPSSAPATAVSVTPAAAPAPIAASPTATAPATTATAPATTATAPTASAPAPTGSSPGAGAPAASAAPGPAVAPSLASRARTRAAGGPATPATTTEAVAATSTGPAASPPATPAPAPAPARVKLTVAAEAGHCRPCIGANDCDDSPVERDLPPGRYQLLCRPEPFLAGDTLRDFGWVELEAGQPRSFSLTRDGRRVVR